MFDGDPYLLNSDTAFSAKKFCGPKTSKFRHDFTQLLDLIANISRMLQDIINQKTTLQPMDTSAQANLNQFTFWSMHLVRFWVYLNI